MISILLHRRGVRFSRLDQADVLTYDHDFDERKPWDEDWIASAFEMAQLDLNFGVSEDLKLLIDRPFAHTVAQSVPFSEKQLAQVLENYLEEEIPEDIELYQFDYRVLDSKPQHSAILGFWIPKSILSAWCHYTDEHAFNSLDIQPAEVYLFDNNAESSRFSIVQDLNGQLRYSGLSVRDTLPQLTLGAWPESCTPELAIKTLRLQGSDWSQCRELCLDKTCEVWSKHMEQLGLDPSITKLKDFNQDPFSLAALQDDRPLLNFRKGEFVQKGILERIVWPISISALCLFAWLISMTWSNLHQAKLVEKGSAQLRQEQKDIWKALFPNKRPPQSRMASQMQGLYGNMTGEGDSHGNEERASVLQTLGLLFTHISPDEDVLIEKAILDKSINLSGVCNNTNSIAQLTEKFKGQTKFKEPSVDTNNKGRNPDYPITFKFSTEYLGAAKP